jgi:hypothetical protein
MLILFIWFCRVGAIAFGFGSAYVWFKASVAKVVSVAPNIDFIGTVQKQGRLNSVAALAMTLATLFQGLALVLESFQSH